MSFTPWKFVKNRLSFRSSGVGRRRDRPVPHLFRLAQKQKYVGPQVVYCKNAEGFAKKPRHFSNFLSNKSLGVL